MSYLFKESFYTLQGEGFHAGTPALFIRLGGCNMWSGREEHRERDALRNKAECPRWCDTDFTDGYKIDAEALHYTLTENLWEDTANAVDPKDVPLVVITGGEPLLQVDAAFIAMLRMTFPNSVLAVETNGTVMPRVPYGTHGGLDWVCVSPKQAPERLKLQQGNELKLVYPAYDPHAYEEYALGFEHKYVSAEATTTGVGESLISKTNLQNAAEFVMRNPDWKLTLQSHKIIGVP